MENEVVEVGTEVVAKGDIIKTSLIVLGVGAIVGIAFGVKKIIEKKRLEKLNCKTVPTVEELPENEVE